jgi:hypothetical protein
LERANGNGESGVLGLFSAVCMMSIKIWRHCRFGQDSVGSEDRYSEIADIPLTPPAE